MHANLINLYPFDGHNKVRSVLGSDESTDKNVNDIFSSRSYVIYPGQHMEHTRAIIIDKRRISVNIL